MLLGIRQRLKCGTEFKPNLYESPPERAWCVLLTLPQVGLDHIRCGSRQRLNKLYSF